jgi:predicted transcriptional regulator
MPRKPSPTLTEAELRIMQVIWEKKRASVAEVTESLKDEADLAYTTVLTMMQILERKGYLTHERAGRAFIYEPLVPKSDARRDAVRQVMSRFFDNSPELLLLNLLEDKEISPAELRRLKKMIEDKK